ncbi:MAG: hypothetical protein AAF604_12365 [Acidobacteriota bacterium]
MRSLISLILVVLIGLWILSLLVFLGHLGGGSTLGNLKLPTSTGELGDSLVIVETLFSSLAVGLALVAVLFQGRELRDSADAQRDQAKALVHQLRRQEEATLVQGYSAQLQVLCQQREWFELIIGRLREERDQAAKPEVRQIKQEKLEAFSGRVRELGDQIKGVEGRLAARLASLENTS